MERYNTRKIDDCGRIILHHDIRKKLGLEEGSRVSLTMVDTILVLQPDPSGSCEINALGLVTIPDNMCKQMSWSEESAIAFYQTDSLVILKSA